MRVNRGVTISGMALAISLALAGTSGAQTAPVAGPLPPTPVPPTPSIEQRLADQERRIGSGLQDGSLTSGEAARLQREESRLNREWARDKADGTISPQERAKMERDLNRASRDIYRERHDAQRANPNNPINQRLGNQADRIANGIQDGSLTKREAARLERQQGTLARAEHQARAEHRGKLTKEQRAKLRRGLNRSSRKISREKHDAQTR